MTKLAPSRPEKVALGLILAGLAACRRGEGDLRVPAQVRFLG